MVAEGEVKIGDLRFSLINTLLLVDRYPPRLGKVGLDTPLLLQVFCPVIDAVAVPNFLVTTPSGRLLLIPNKGRSEIRTACVPCTRHEEDDLFTRLILFLAESSKAEDWGNYAEISDIEISHLDAAILLLAAYELPCSTLFMGRKAYKKMRSHMRAPKDEKRCPFLKDLLYKSDELGFYDDKPVFLLPESLSDFCILNAPSECVGGMTRVGDYVALLMHNITRSMAIYKIV